VEVTAEVTLYLHHESIRANYPYRFHPTPRLPIFACPYPTELLNYSSTCIICRCLWARPRTLRPGKWRGTRARRRSSIRSRSGRDTHRRRHLGRVPWRCTEIQRPISARVIENKPRLAARERLEPRFGDSPRPNAYSARSLHYRPTELDVDFPSFERGQERERGGGEGRKAGAGRESPRF